MSKPGCLLQASAEKRLSEATLTAPGKPGMAAAMDIGQKAVICFIVSCCQEVKAVAACIQGAKAWSAVKGPSAACCDFSNCVNHWPASGVEGLSMRGLHPCLS